MTAEKIARLGIERRQDTMYFLKNGDVWGVRRKVPGEPMGSPMLIAEAGIEMDYSRYLYFVDSEGDVARRERAIPKTKAKKKKKKAATKKQAKKKKSARKKKTTKKKKRETSPRSSRRS